jgi:hypothetical protein
VVGYVAELQQFDTAMTAPSGPVAGGQGAAVASGGPADFAMSDVLPPVVVPDPQTPGAVLADPALTDAHWDFADWRMEHDSDLALTDAPTDPRMEVPAGLRTDAPTDTRTGTPPDLAEGDEDPPDLPTASDAAAPTAPWDADTAEILGLWARLDADTDPSKGTDPLPSDTPVPVAGTSPPVPGVGRRRLRAAVLTCAALALLGAAGIGYAALNQSPPTSGGALPPGSQVPARPADPNEFSTGAVPGIDPLRLAPPTSGPGADASTDPTDAPETPAPGSPADPGAGAGPGGPAAPGYPAVPGNPAAPGNPVTPMEPATPQDPVAWPPNTTPTVPEPTFTPSPSTPVAPQVPDSPESASDRPGKPHPTKKPHPKKAAVQTVAAPPISSAPLVSSPLATPPTSAVAVSAPSLSTPSVPAPTAGLSEFTIPGLDALGLDASGQNAAGLDVSGVTASGLTTP